MIGDLDEDLTGRAANELGPDVLGLRLDVTDHAGFTAVLDEVERELGPLDILINNAGIMPVAMFEDETPETTARPGRGQLPGAAARHAGGDPADEAARHGHIVNIASMAGVVPTPGAATYCATKHAVVGLTESVSWELRGTGVDISCVLPALVNTELAAGSSAPGRRAAIEPEVVATEIVKALKRPKLRDLRAEADGGDDEVVRPAAARVGEKIMTATGSDHLLADAITTGHGGLRGASCSARRALRGRDPSSERAFGRLRRVR